MNAAKRTLIKLAVIGTLATGAIVTPMMASAAPSNYPENPHACVGYSSTTANTVYQGSDPAKYRDEQAQRRVRILAAAASRGDRTTYQGIFDGCEAASYVRVCDVIASGPERISGMRQ